MSDDSTQRGCANKEHQTNYSQSGGANSHSVDENRAFVVVVVTGALYLNGVECTRV